MNTRHPRPIVTIAAVGAAVLCAALAPGVAQAAAPARRAAEPSEAQMRQALQDRLDAASAAQRRMAGTCDPDNPMTIMGCLMSAGQQAGGGSMGSIGRILYFEKLSCGEATTNGYICDYVIQQDMGPGNAILGGAPTQSGTGRFIHTPSRGWVVITR